MYTNYFHFYNILETTKYYIQDKSASVKLN